MPSESVDAVVTDPPAGISFMSKTWDRDKGGRTQWVAWMTEVMRECYRVLKPGGYAVVWSLPRTCHWTAWAMEDAGFIIRDQLAHVFASGFPKGKAQLKPAREDWWLARKPGPLRPLAIDECRIGVEERYNAPAASNDGPTPYGPPSNDEHPGTYVNGRWPSNVLLSDADLFDVANPGVVGSGAVSASGVMRGGTERKPDVEAAKVAYGTFSGNATDEDTYGDTGGYSRFFIIPKADRADREPVLRGQVAPKVWSDGRDVAADYPSQRGKTSRENGHPTVKPTDLMRHLVRLVTPSGGTVLDPFLGSGSTALACELEGFPWIGVEKELEYVKIAEARLNGVQRGLGLDVPAPTRVPSRTGQQGPTPETNGQARWTEWREDSESPEDDAA